MELLPAASTLHSTCSPSHHSSTSSLSLQQQLPNNPLPGTPAAQPPTSSASRRASSPLDRKAPVSPTVRVVSWKAPAPGPVAAPAHEAASWKLSGEAGRCCGGKEGAAGLGGYEKAPDALLGQDAGEGDTSEAATHGHALSRAGTQARYPGVGHSRLETLMTSAQDYSDRMRRPAPGGVRAQHAALALRKTHRASS
jgi:hypothetical protein